MCMHCLEEYKLEELLDQDRCSKCDKKGCVSPWQVSKCPGCNKEYFNKMDELKMQIDNRIKWDLRFLKLAKEISTWSKDPSTQTGAVITDTQKRVISVGYNGLPQGIEDTEERYNNRELKYLIICHCERNAIIFAERNLENCVLYTWPFASCATCASMVIQSGIKRCVAPEVPEHLKERWADNMKISMQLFKEAKIEVTLYKQEDLCALSA